MRRLFSLVLIIPLLFSAVEARAATLIAVDQNQVVIVRPDEVGSAFGFGVFRRRPGSIPPTFNSTLAQTFTAGNFGTLERIEFQIFSGSVRDLNDRVRFTLLDGDYAAGSRSIVGFQDVNFSQIPSIGSVLAGQNLISFDTSPFAYIIRPGSRYSVVFEVVPGNQVANLSALIGIFEGQIPLPGGGFQFVIRGSGYTGGGLFFLDQNGLPDLTGDPQDIGFRSFVSLTAVPEPETWLMMIVGFAGVGIIARQKPKQFRKSLT